MARKQPIIGTVSHGTLRNEDLLNAFASELRRLVGDDPTEAETALLRDAETTLKGETDDDDACELVNELQDALSSLAPSYCYFGSIDGDGSDFGFWVCMEHVEQARQDDELASGDQLPESSPLCEFLVVSDHGNATLYQRNAKNQKWREVWGIV